MIVLSKLRSTGLALVMTSLLVACANPNRSPAPPVTNWQEARDVIESGYRGITEKYIEPLDMADIGLYGIQGLASIDPALTAVKSDNKISLRYSGRLIYTVDQPADNDPGQWADVTRQMAKKAQAYSSDVRAADAEKLYVAIFDGVLSKLDLFSRYAGAEDARRNRARRDGFGGIGIRYKISNGEVVILSVTPEMPAAHAGIQSGDIITHVDGVSIEGLTVREITSQVRGPTHTTVGLTIVREGVDDPYEHELTRKHIVPPTVSEKRLGDVLYYKVSSFNQDTSHSLSTQLEKAVGEMGDQLKGVVLDMRGNPGGLLKQSVKAADLFLTQGNIVSTKGRHADSLHIYEAGGRDLTGGLPLMVLIDGKSASAAEIVAAALQDRERAVLIGTSSYGKGTVQTVLRLPNDGEITLTWSRLVAPSGYALHGLGVRPELCVQPKNNSVAKMVKSALDRNLSTKAVFEQWRNAQPHESDRFRTLRDSCPATRRDGDVEMEIATRLIRHPAEYMQALNLSAAPNQAHK